MPTQPAGGEPLRLKTTRLPKKSAWELDFVFIRNFCRAMLRPLRREMNRLLKEEQAEAVANTGLLKRLFGNKDPMADSLVKVGMLLLRWHEQGLRRAQPGVEQEPPLEEADYDVMKRNMEKLRPGA